MEKHELKDATRQPCCTITSLLHLLTPSLPTILLFFFPAFWSFMWFVGFCFLANQWQMSKLEDNPLREGGDAARAAITFCFFSIFTWVRAGLWAVTVGVTMGFTRLLSQQGAQTLFSMEKLKNVSFEEEYIKLFPPQPNQPFV